MDKFLQDKAMALGAISTGPGWARFPSMGQALGFASRFVQAPQFEGSTVFWKRSAS